MLNAEIQGWTQDPEFQALPYQEKQKILDNYFHGQLADQDFFALPYEEQAQIRTNFAVAHIGEDPTPPPPEPVAPPEPATISPGKALVEGTKDVARSTLQTVKGSEEARNVEAEAKRFGVSGDRGPLQSLMTPGMRQDVVEGILGLREPNVFCAFLVVLLDVLVAVPVAARETV